jgi:hypothetical protein
VLAKLELPEPVWLERGLGPPLLVRVMDHDLVTCDDVVAEATISMKDVHFDSKGLLDAPRDVAPSWHALTAPYDGQRCGVAAGQILLSYELFEAFIAMRCVIVNLSCVRCHLHRHPQHMSPHQPGSLAPVSRGP